MNIEKPTIEEARENEVVLKELEILEHREAPKNELQAQFILAEELYMRDVNRHPDMKEREMRNTIMTYWGGSGYSALFRALFRDHPKFRDNFKSITLETLDFYMRNPGVLKKELTQIAA